MMCITGKGCAKEIAETERGLTLLYIQEDTTHYIHVVKINNN